MSRSETDARLAELWTVGTDVHDIAAEISIARASVYRRVRTLGLPRRRQRARRIVWTPQITAAFVTAWVKGVPLDTICDRFGLAPQQAKQRAYDLGARRP